MDNPAFGDRDHNKTSPVNKGRWIVRFGSMLSKKDFAEISEQH